MSNFDAKDAFHFVAFPSILSPMACSVAHGAHGHDDVAGMWMCGYAAAN